MAVVVDEYGGVAGVVTLELLLEEMVGRVVDELGQPSEEFAAIDEHTTRVDGGMSIYDVREELEHRLPGRRLRDGGRLRAGPAWATSRARARRSRSTATPHRGRR